MAQTTPQEFLFYTQKEREYRRSNNRCVSPRLTCASTSRCISRNDMPPQAPGERWHKQTLSVMLKDPHDSYHTIPRKWHMSTRSLPGRSADH